MARRYWGKNNYHATAGRSLMKMMADGELAKRFERYDDARLAGALAEIEGLPLSDFERHIVDDIKAEQKRRADFAARHGGSATPSVPAGNDG